MVAFELGMGCPVLPRAGFDMGVAYVNLTMAFTIGWRVVPSILVWHCQEVAYSCFRPDEHWMIGIHFKFFAQAATVNSKAVNSAIVNLTPHSFCQAGMSHYMTGISHQVMENMAFGRGDTYLFVPVEEFARNRIETQRSTH